MASNKFKVGDKVRFNFSNDGGKWSHFFDIQQLMRSNEEFVIVTAVHSGRYQITSKLGTHGACDDVLFAASTALKLFIED